MAQGAAQAFGGRLAGASHPAEAGVGGRFTRPLGPLGRDALSPVAEAETLRPAGLRLLAQLQCGVGRGAADEAGLAGGCDWAPLRRLLASTRPV